MDVRRLSRQQKAIWLTQNIYQYSSLYNVGGYACIKGQLDQGRLRESISSVLRGVDVIHLADSSPTKAAFTIQELDFSEAENAEEQALKWMQEDMLIGFEEKQTLLELAIIKQADELHYWYVKVHHIAFDGFSMALFFNKVAKHYEQEDVSLSRSMSSYTYATYLEDEKQYLQSEEYKKDKAFWLENFSKRELGKAFASCFKQQAGSTLKSERKNWTIPRSQFEKIEELSNRLACTPLHFFVASLYLLNKSYNNENFVIGLPVFNRRNKYFKNTLGTFVNILPFRVEEEGCITFLDLLLKVKRELRECYKHQRYPLIDLLEDIDKEGNIYNLVFSYQKNEYLQQLGEATTTITFLDNGEQETDLAIHLLDYASEKDLVLAWDYRTDLFEERQIESLMKHFGELLHSILEQTEGPISQFTGLTKAEYGQLIHDFNNAVLNLPQKETIITLFESQALKTPEAPALLLGEKQLTYQELNEKANRLANYLLQNFSIQANDLIGLMLERGESLLVSMLGILKSGAAYVPLDPNYPEERVQYMLEDSAARLLIDSEFLKDFQQKANTFSSENPQCSISASDLAYLIYTSGSTGLPKGVMIEHRNVHAFIHWCYQEFSPSTFELVYAVTSVCFDLSIFEIFYTLTIGKPLRVLESALEIPMYIGRDQSVLLNTVPSVVAGLLQEKVSLKNISLLNMAGEPIPDLLFTLLEEESISVRNLYGPSETTTYSTFCRLDKNKKRSIGTAIANTQVYILNKDQKTPSPLGVVGEIYIGGAGVSRGYINQPKLTAQCYHSNPFIPGERIYRTGDLARYLPDGTIELLGRSDDQVKIRGHRIEMGEIEKRLLDLKGIDTALLIAYQDSSGNKELAAFILSEQKQDAVKLKEDLGKSLPTYMIPAQLIQLEKLPLTPNGKVDKRALASIALSSESTLMKYVAPSNEEEKQLVEIWEEILGREQIGIKDDFFQLGGNSLKVMGLFNKVYQQTGLKLVLSDLFRFRTIEEQAHLMRKTAQTSYQKIPQLASQASYEPSFAQRRLWVLSQLDDAGKAYHMPGIFKLEGKLDREALNKAFQQLIAQHEILRTTFNVNEEGVLRQYIQEPEEIRFNINWEEDIDTGTIAEEIIQREIAKTFDLSKGPLLRVSVFQLTKGQCLLLCVMHHIISDAWSMQVLTKDLARAYNMALRKERVKEERRKIQYKEYAAWQKQQLEEEAFQGHRKYWLEQLSGELPTIRMPEDYTRPVVKSYEGDTVKVSLDNKQLTELRNYAQQEGVTMFVALLSLVNLLLFRYSEQKDIIVGSPVAGREHADLEEQIGCYINTLPIRTQIEGSETFEDFFHNVKRQVLDAFEHQAYPFDVLLEELSIKRDTSRSPVFDIMLNLRNEELITTALSTGLEGLNIDLEDDLCHTTSKYDLSFNFIEASEGLRLELEYCRAIFDRSTIVRLGKHFNSLLEKVLEDPTTSIARLDYLLQEEKEYYWKQAKASFFQNQGPDHLIPLFEQVVKSHPDKIALTCAERNYSYQELNKRANHLADFLKEHYQLKEETLIGIKLERNEHLLISILAILKTGAAYLPIDPLYPEERIQYLLEDSKCSLLIDEEVLGIAEAWVAEGKRWQSEIDYKGEQLAYVIYTSGSTGKPKGVMIEHRNVVTFLQNYQQGFGLSESTVFAATTNPGFDISVLELLGPLMSGARVYLLEETDPKSILKPINEGQVNTLQLTPSRLDQLLETEAEVLTTLGKLDTLLLGGEALSKEKFKKLKQLSNTRVLNVYGPTETTIWSTMLHMNEAEHLSIGKPLLNEFVYILDQKQQLVPPGIIGELCIGGAGLARGYFNRPKLTAEAFIKDPYKENQRLYKTGDFARMLPDGSFEYIGRSDAQVKIRGYRIELGEIEAALRKLRGVERGAVLVEESKEGKRLLAYLQTKEVLTLSGIRQELSTKLPAYMLPSQFTLLEEFPLTASGKLDRKALEKQLSKKILTDTAFEAPKGEFEKQLANLWGELLGLDDQTIGRKANFFMLGGHSLNASSLISRIAKKWGYRLSLKDIFLQPVLEEQAKLLSKKQPELYSEISRLEEQEAYPLSLAQQRLWVLSQFKGGNEAYNIPASIHLKGKYSFELLKKAIVATIARHEALRTVFKEDKNGELKQWIKAARDISDFIEYKDYREEGTQDQLIEAYIQEDSYQPFDLVNGPLLRVVVFQKKEEHFVLYYNLHHIIGDGASLEVLREDILTYYQVLEQKQAPVLEPLDIQYKDYAAWQLKQLKSGALDRDRAYWLKQFEHLPPNLEFPTSKQRPMVKTSAGHKLSIVVSKEETAQLRAFAKENEGTLFAAIMATLGVLFYKYTGQKELVMGSPVSGRYHTSLEKQVGFYANTLPIKYQLQEKSSFLEHFSSVKKQVLEALEYQAYPFDQLVQELNLKRDTSRSALFDVLVVLQNKQGTHLDLGVEKLEDCEEVKVHGPVRSKFDLELSFQEVGEHLKLELIYNSDLYEQEVLEAFLLHYQKLLTSLLKQPSEKLKNVSYLTEEEQQRLFSFLGKSINYPEHTVMHLLEQQVIQSPEAIAVEFEEEKITYQDLNEQSNRLAHFLQKDPYFQQGESIGVMLKRSPESVIAMIAVMKAGGVYVPIDHAYPTERVQYIINDAHIRRVLTQEELKEKHSIDKDQFFCLENTVASFSHENPVYTRKLEEAAFIIYTSGSTGKPKGVIQTHSMLSNLIQWNRAEAGIEKGLRHLQYASFSFDVSLQDCWWILSSGGTLCVLSESLRLDFLRLRRYLIEKQVEVLSLPFSVLNNLFLDLEEIPLSGHKIRHIISSGEQLVLNAGLKYFLEENPAICLHNHYGPSETHVVTFYTLNKNRDNIVDRSPIGRPLANTDVYLLDQDRQLLPFGVPGELYIGGKNLALGYQNLEELTRERFIENPFKPGRLYKTGDLARWTKDGVLEYLGRRDTQIKLRGFRIELEEIEKALQKFDGIEAAVVAIQKNKLGEEVLAGYLVSEQEIDQNFLKKELKKQLPDYMVPNYFAKLRIVPLSSNGKVDRSKLPDLEKFGIAEGTEYTAPRDKIEEDLASMWKELLELEKVGINNNFFELGGHSLKMNTLLNRVKSKFGVEISFELFLNDPTIESMALHVSNFQSMSNKQEKKEQKKLII
jgi:amino acid adenylation domain-containing protein